MNVHVVLAQPKDMKSIRSVQKTTWLQTYPNEKEGITRKDIEKRFCSDDTQEGKKQLEERAAWFFKPNAHTWVGKDGDVVVGYCLAVKDVDIHRIQALYVLPEYQGKGIGTACIHNAIQWLGLDKAIVIHVASYNENAIRFYKTIGFIETGKDLKDDYITLSSGAVIHEIELVLPQIQ